MRKHAVLLSLLCAMALVFPRLGFAIDFFSSHNTGWYFYDDPETDDDPPKPKLQNTAADAAVLHALSVEKQQLKIAKAHLVMMPTVPHARDYIRLQNAASRQAARVAQVWKRALLYYPELDFSLKHPTRSVARRIAIDAQSKKIEQALNTFSKHQGLFFFYKSTCPYCRRFAPVVKRLVEQYHIQLIPITLNGLSLPLFPHSRRDAGQAHRFGVHATPALFAIDPRTKKVTPISYGFIAEDTLKARLSRVATEGRAV